MSKHTNRNLTSLAAALGAAVAVGVSAAPMAAENPFSVKPLSSGYMVATKAGEGRCGEGRCGGASGEQTKPKTTEAKCGEGRCGAAGTKTADEADKAADGKPKKASEGKCGEGRCGGR